MLIDRIVGAFTFKKGVYASAANDATFTNSAWLIVMVAVLLSQVGSRASSSIGFFHWLLGTLLNTVIGVGAFAVGAYVIKWLAGALYKVNVTFEQIVRSLGLSYIWKVIGLIGIISVIPFLVCISAPIRILDILVAFAAALFAIKETTNMEWLNTVVVTVIATIIGLIIAILFSTVFGLIGL